MGAGKDSWEMGNSHDVPRAKAELKHQARKVSLGFCLVLLRKVSKVV